MNDRMLQGDRTCAGARNLSVSDRLAVDRTVLANTRTLLAYIRTALACLALGASFQEFFSNRELRVVGVLFIAVSIVLAIVGVLQFLNFRRRLAKFLRLERSA